MAEAQSAPAQTKGLSSKMCLDDISVKDKRVLIRVDFNVPMADGKIKDSRRISAALPTIKRCIAEGARSIVLMSHLGRPKGQVKESLTLAPVARELAKQLGVEVFFSPVCVGEDIDKVVENAPVGGVILLENLRFHVEEEGKGVNASGEKVTAVPEEVKKFRENLSKHCKGEVYINDAFGTAHRAHSSMVGVDAEFKVAGKLMEKELNYFGKVLESPEKPLLGILGGSKISDKIQLINNMLDKVDMLIIAGGMAFSFLKHHIDEDQQMQNIGNSLYEDKAETLVPEIMKNAKARGVKIVLPCDFLCGPKTFFSEDNKQNVQTTLKKREEGIEEGMMGLDCGLESQKLFAETISRAKTIVWNGPPGVFEFEAFAGATKAMLKAIIENESCVSVIGGGDTASAVKKFNGEAGVTHISTGGGASLELLEGKVLPGVAALSEKPEKREDVIMS